MSAPFTRIHIVISHVNILSCQIAAICGCLPDTLQARAFQCLLLVAWQRTYHQWRETQDQTFASIAITGILHVYMWFCLLSVAADNYPPALPKVQKCQIFPVWQLNVVAPYLQYLFKSRYAMQTVNIHEAKTQFSRFVDQAEACKKHFTFPEYFDMLQK